MGDEKPAAQPPRAAPQLPEGAPAELRDFFGCKSTSLTLKKETLTWLPLPVAPEVSFEHGAGPGAVDIVVSVSADLPVVGPKGVNVVRLPASVRSGRLEVDTTKVPLPDFLGGQKARADIDRAVKEINDWFAENGYEWERLKLRGGSVSLVKRPITGVWPRPTLGAATPPTSPPTKPATKPAPSAPGPMRLTEPPKAAADVSVPRNPGLPPVFSGLTPEARDAAKESDRWVPSGDKGLAAFIACETEVVRLVGGTGKAGDGGRDDVTYEAGAPPNTARVRIQQWQQAKDWERRPSLEPLWNGSVTVSLENGELHIDTTALSLQTTRDEVDRWVREFNRWMKHNGKRLRDLIVDDISGSLTLIKAPLRTVTPGPPVIGAAGRGTAKAPANMSTVAWRYLALVMLLGLLLITGAWAVLGGGFGGLLGAGLPVSPSPSPPTVTSSPRATPSSSPRGTVTPTPAQTATTVVPTATAARPTPPPALARILDHLRGVAAVGPTRTVLVDLLNDLFHSAGVKPGRTDRSIDIAGATAQIRAYSQATVDALFNKSAFPCGKLLDGAFTICAAGDPPASAGRWLIVVAALDAAVPLNDLTAGRIYSVDVGADDDPVNDYHPSAAFPNDTLQGADFNYTLWWIPKKKGWGVYATDYRVASPTIGNATSTARAVLWDQGLAFFIPLAELQAATPRYRVATAVTDPDFTYDAATTAVDVLPEGPGTDWALATPDVVP